MSFVGLLRPELVVLDPPWRGFRDTAAGLVGTLAAAGVLPAGSDAEAVRAVVAREAEASTAVLETGVGVPHARLAGLRGSCVALAISSAGFYEPVPTVRIRIVALVLSPLAATNDHLRILAGIATLLHSAELRAALLQARGPDAVLRTLAEHTRSAP